MNTLGAKGCTGEAKEISNFCAKNKTNVYIIAGKSTAALMKAANEQKAANPGKRHPFAGVTFISDPTLSLVDELGKESDYTQIIGKESYFKRFNFVLEDGRINGEIKFNNPSITPADAAKTTLAEFTAKDAARSML